MPIPLLIFTGGGGSKTPQFGLELRPQSPAFLNGATYLKSKRIQDH